MGARTKLNEFYFLLCLVGAGLAGLACGSWWVFLGLLALLVACCMHAGDIR